ncbi:MAG TPA: DUF4861 family protein [Bacteroidota bacterium]|nr:DUF4861 family protein [Bacteroidota bacterium]
MKRIVAHVAVSLFLAGLSAAQTHEAIVRVSNPSTVPRHGETVEVPLASLRMPGDIPNAFAVRPAEGGSVLTSQATDSLLLFQADIPAGGVREFRVERLASPPPPHVPLVDGRYVLPREDYAWENDRIAFRMYGPALASEVNNGIDVWTKRVRSLIVEKWYREAEAAPGTDWYHHDRGEGADFFDTGRSLGAGACALWSGGRVHQPGVFSSWKTIACGPLRVEFELTYASVDAGEGPVTERMRIALDAGQNLNRITVIFSRAGCGGNLGVAWGLVKRKGVTLTRSGSWMGLWGMTNSDTVNGSLGIGVVLPPFTDPEPAEDSVQVLLVGRVKCGVPFTYYAGAGWTRSGDFSSRGDWEACLASRAAALASPLSVTVERGPKGVSPPGRNRE